MENQFHRRVEEILLAALDLDPASRGAWLDVECGDNLALRAEVDSLLEEADLTKGFLEVPAIMEILLSPESGHGGVAKTESELTHGIENPERDRRGTSPLGAEANRIGKYRILRPLGEGGMGQVYLAQQTEPLQREVALKVVVAEGPRGTLFRRSFEIERQVMARLNHPNIAQVYDAGSTPQGAAYLAMELISGGPITHFCNREKLGVSSRLELFERVCRGVHHAHQKGVLHRDIKPSNVLIATTDGHPIPKVIDFGIAKGLDSAKLSGLTEAGFVGTPSYMAPETILGPSGEDVDIRSDVYSLGVLLHVLLIDGLPNQRDTGNLVGLVEGVRSEVSRPVSRSFAKLEASEALRCAELRATTPERLSHRLRGDLDWIVGKATAVEREHRYSSVQDFIADLERHQKSLPVLASPPNRWYLARKFFLRHRLQVGAALLVTMAMLVAIIGTSLGFVQARRAEEGMRLEAEIARQAQAGADEVSHFLVELFTEIDPFDYGNVDTPRGAEVTARQLLDRGVERIEGRLGDQPEVRARLLHTLAQVRMRLGLLDQARPLLEEAVVLRTQNLGAAHLDTALSHRLLGRLFEDFGNYAEAEVHYRQALVSIRTILGEHDPETIVSLQYLAKLLLTRGEQDEALPMLRETLLRADEVFDQDHPIIGETLNALGWLHYGRGDLLSAEKMFRRVFEMDLRMFGAGSPNTAIVGNNLSWVLVRLERLAEAEQLIESTLVVFQQTLPAGHWRTANAESVLAAIWARQGRHAEAEHVLLQSLPIVHAGTGEGSPYTRELLGRIVDLYNRWGKPGKAEKVQKRWAGVRPTKH